MRVKRAHVEAVFDIAISSLDWGSGFLDNEEVDHLRALAVALDRNPADATPPEHRARYCTGHQWYDHSSQGQTGTHRRWTCSVCLKDSWGVEPPAVDWGMPS